MTRAPEQAGELIRALELHGAVVFLLPTVGFAPVADMQELDAAIRGIEEHDWILFTSANAVRFLCQRCRELGVEPRSLQTAKPLVGTIGPATAKAASAEGLRVDYVAKDHGGVSLAREMADWVAGRSIFLPRSDRADGRLPEALRESGAQVTEVVAYRTTIPETLDENIVSRVRHGDVEAIVFASPSAFRNLCLFVSAHELAALSKRIQFVAIGSTTARALREAGIRVDIEARESSPNGLAEAIINFYQHHASTARLT